MFSNTDFEILQKLSSMKQLTSHILDCNCFIVEVVLYINCSFTSEHLCCHVVVMVLIKIKVEKYKLIIHKG